MLSDDIKGFWDNLASAYTDNPTGMKLTADDFQAMMGRVWEMYHGAVYLESQIPPPPPKIEGDNIVSFKEFSQTKIQRRN